MNLEALYYEVKQTMERVDFSKLWPGFVPLKFALYSDSECFFDGQYVEKTDAFLGNTAILYNGEWIAIWYVQETMDPIVLTSKMVHEMFHGFQQIHNESRFPDELEALYQYRYDAGNLDVKLTENQLLYRLTEQFDADAFEEFCQFRKYRSNAFGYEYHYEASIEQIEGTANYVELKCLKQLSEERFRNKLSYMKENIINPNNLLPVRIVSYDIGALLLLVMNENGIAFDHGFSLITFSEAMLDGVEEKLCMPKVSTGEQIADYYVKAGEIIGRAISENNLVTDAESDLLGVNVYNAVYYKDHIISQYCVLYGSAEEPKVEYGNFVIETKECKKLTKIYRM